MISTCLTGTENRLTFVGTLNTDILSIKHHFEIRPEGTMISSSGTHYMAHCIYSKYFLTDVTDLQWTAVC